MSLEKEVMLVYGSNLDIYNIKVKKFIQAISVSVGSGRTDYYTSAGDNTRAQEKLKNKLMQKALEVGADGVIDVKSCGELGSSLGGNAVTLEGKGFEEFVKDREIARVEELKHPTKKKKSLLFKVLMVVLIILAIPAVQIIGGVIIKLMEQGTN